MILRNYACGKLLISGEYLVLKGAQALVLPLKKGQSMQIEPISRGDGPVIEWHATVGNEFWFNAEIGIRGWTINKSSNSGIALKLIPYLKTLASLNTALFFNSLGYKITTETGFDMNWGFGSSSALIANLASWAKVDPFDFYFRVTQGSGADLAAALSSGPILYQLLEGKPEVKPVNFRPRFHDHIWFIYLGRKQNSGSSVAGFNANTQVTAEQIAMSNRITQELLSAAVLKDFENAVMEHEMLMAPILRKQRIKEVRFPDFRGEVKSLGAWGGDFAMAVSGQDEKTVRSYFKQKGLDTMMSFDELILS